MDESSTTRPIGYTTIVITLRTYEMEALKEMAERERRYPKQQVQWLIAKAAAEAGLLYDVGIESLKEKDE